MNNEHENLAIDEDAETETDRPNNTRRLAIMGAAIACVLLAAAVVAIWFFRDGNVGKPVPAPRDTSFGDPANASTPSDATITLAPDQVDRAGIKVEPVGETLAAQAGRTLTAGVIQPNSYRETPINSLLGGVVRRVNVQLGDRVKKGQPVAVIFSDELAQVESKYLVALNEKENAAKNYDRETRLLRISPSSNAELDEAKAKLTATEARLAEHHKHHLRTSRLLEIGAVSQEEFEQASTLLQTAEADLEEARRRYERAVEVAKVDPVNRASFEQASVRLRTAESDLISIREKLQLFGLPPQKIDSLRSMSQVTSELVLRAPASGTVTARGLNVGEVVEANKELMRITDLSTVWAVAQVYENELGYIKKGSGVNVTVATYPDRTFRGQVTYIDPNINQETRTGQVRVELSNADEALRIGMYVNVAFADLREAEKTAPVIPTSAVQNIANGQVVFVATDQPNIFIMRPVRLAPETNDQYVVLEGVKVGDRVVTEGSFMLRAEWLKLHPAGT